ncbi:MAG: ABC transporter permease [Crenarchaeota archaeon]|nr:ABC transporter permease [Thermoproteota archaeon]
MNEILIMIWRNKRAFTGIMILCMFVVLGIIAVTIAPYSSIRVEGKNILPCLEHPLSTDPLGRDLFIMIFDGAPKILFISFLAAGISTLVGLLVGILAGYKGGRADSILTAITDVVLNIPGLPLYIAIAAYFQKVPQLAYNPLVIAGVLSITAWAGLARSVRSQVLGLKSRPFIEAAKLLGLPTRHIVFSEILPNVAGYIAINFIFSATGAVYAIVGLYFLGILPVDPTNWGMMLSIAYNAAGGFLEPRLYYILLAPLLAIILLQEGFILSSHAMEEIFNPRLRTEYHRKLEKKNKKTV